MKRILAVVVGTIAAVLLNVSPAHAYTPKVLDQADKPFCVGYATTTIVNASVGNRYDGRTADSFAALWLGDSYRMPAPVRLSVFVEKVYGLKTVEYTTGAEALKAVQAGHPVAFTSLIYVDRDSMFYGVYDYEPTITRHGLKGLRADYSEGDHEMAAIAMYHGDVLVQNSWGTTWGKYGRILLSPRDFIAIVNTTISYMPAFSVSK